MSYELVPGLQEDQWLQSVSILSLYEGALGQRADNKGGDNLHDIKSPEEAAAIIGKTNVNGKDLLMEYCNCLEAAYKRDPESAIDRMSDVGVLQDFENFKKDRQKINDAIRSVDSIKLINDLEMDSIAGEELKPDAIERTLSLTKSRAEAAKEEIEKELELIQMKNDDEMPPSHQKKVKSIERDADEIEKIADRIKGKSTGTKVDEEAIRLASERQKNINAAIQREKAFKFYESAAGKSMISSYQQSMAWVSARAAGRKSPGEEDRKLASETIAKLKQSHAYGHRKFTIELVLTKSRSEQVELKKHPNFAPLKPSEVFTKKKPKLSRAQDGRYSAKEEKALNSALDKQSKKRQKEIDNDKK